MPLAHSNTNAIEGFKVSAIVPMNKNIFTHYEFINTYVTYNPYMKKSNTPIKIFITS